MNLLKKKEYICTLNDNLRYEVEAIQDLDFTNATISEIPDLQKQLSEITGRILLILNDMKERGIAMEARLIKYRETIMNLGYERVKTVD